MFMSFPLKLQFCPSYRQLLDAGNDKYEMQIQSNINYCKIMSCMIALENKTTIEQGTLLHFELLVNESLSIS